MKYALAASGKQVHLQVLKLLVNHSHVCRHCLPTECGLDWQTSVEYIERRATGRPTPAFIVALKLRIAQSGLQKETVSGTAAATYKNSNATAINGCQHCRSHTPTAFMHSGITTHPTPARACTRTQPRTHAHPHAPITRGRTSTDRPCRLQGHKMQRGPQPPNPNPWH